MIHQYTGLSFLEIQKLNVFEHQLFLRDGYIHGLAGSEKGRKYLENAARMEITEPDRKAWRKFMQGGVDALGKQQ